MKSTGRYMFYVLLLLVPLVYGYLVNTMTIPLFPFVMQVVFLVFWFYVGYLFSKWETPAWKSLFSRKFIMVIVFHFVYMAICFSGRCVKKYGFSAFIATLHACICLWCCEITAIRDQRNIYYVQCLRNDVSRVFIGIFYE